MGGYSIYMIFADDTRKRGSRMRLYGGWAYDKDDALGLARKVLGEEGGGVEAVEVIDWSGRSDGAYVYRLESEDIPSRDAS